MTEHSTSESHPVAFRTAIAAAIALLGFVLIFIESFDFGHDAAFFPRIIAVAGGLSSMSVLTSSLLKVMAGRRAGKRAGSGAALKRTDFVISYVTPLDRKSTRLNSSH